MNLRKFLRQSATLQRKGEPNTYGEASHSDPEVVLARVEEKQNQVRSAQGAEMLSTTKVTTEVEVAVGDLVNGQEVAARESIVDLGGRVLGWVSYL